MSVVPIVHTNSYSSSSSSEQVANDSTPRDLARAALHSDEDALPWDHFSVEIAVLGTSRLVHLRGGLDFMYAEELRDALVGVTGDSVVVDLHRLTFIDSTGLAALLSARRQVQSEGRAFAICGAQGLVRRVFEASELSDVLDA